MTQFDDPRGRFYSVPPEAPSAPTSHLRGRGRNRLRSDLVVAYLARLGVGLPELATASRMSLTLLRAILASEDVSKANLARLLKGLDVLSGHDLAWMHAESRTSWLRRFVEDRDA